MKKAHVVKQRQPRTREGQAGARVRIIPQVSEEAELCNNLNEAFKINWQEKNNKIQRMFIKDHFWLHSEYIGDNQN